MIVFLVFVISSLVLLVVVTVHVNLYFLIFHLYCSYQQPSLCVVNKAVAVGSILECYVDKAYLLPRLSRVFRIPEFAWITRGKPRNYQ